MNDAIELTVVGQFLDDEFMQPYNLSASELAQAINAPLTLIDNVLNGAAAMTADLDLRLGRLFGVSAGYFLRYQERMATIAAQREIADDLARITPLVDHRPLATAAAAN